jgi:hypothetical protein
MSFTNLLLKSYKWPIGDNVTVADYRVGLAENKRVL